MATKKPETAATAAPQSSAIHTVLDVLHHDGRRYDVGDLVELTEAQAAALPVGVVAPAPARE